MGNPEGARKDSKAIVISLVPDICLTPAGPTQVPVPYPVIASFGQSSDVSRNVNFAGQPVFLLDQSSISQVIGDASGVGGGIKSGTVGGKAEPVSGSRSIRVNGKSVVREGDLFTMNSGNTCGVVVFMSDAPAAVPPASPEKTTLEKISEGVKGDVEAIPKNPSELLEMYKGEVKNLVNQVPETIETMHTLDAWSNSTKLRGIAFVGESLGQPEIAESLNNAADQIMLEADQFSLPKCTFDNPNQILGDHLMTGAQFASVGADLLKLGQSGLKLLRKILSKAAKKQALKAARSAAKKLEEAAVKAEKAAAKKAGAVAGDGLKVSRLKVVIRNGYEYHLDELGRVKAVKGKLRPNPNQIRNRKAQLGAGGKDRLPTDEGGHWIGRRFDGPTDDFNHFAQNGNFNKGVYKQLENEWANALKNGQEVIVDIRPSYVGNSLRPDKIDIIYSIGDEVFPVQFLNMLGGGL